MKRLLLLRHGEAEPASAASDFDRALTAHGRAQALQAARRLRQARCLPDAMRVSPTLRTRETATIVAARLKCLQLLRYEPRCYPGELESLLQLIREVEDDPRTLLLVGHNPGLSALARRLATLAPLAPSSTELPELRTGGLYRIELAAPAWPQIETTGVTSVTLLP